jgi:hypothetical protein
MIKLAETELNQEFPAFSTTENVRPIDSTLLGNALGIFNAIYDVDIFFKNKVKPLQKHFYLENPYSFYLDQPHLTYDKAWYEDPLKRDNLTALLKGKSFGISVYHLYV